MKTQVIQNILYASLLTAFASCGGKKDDKAQQPPPPTPVEAVAVTASPASYFDEYPATVTALNQIDIRAQVSGYITGIFFTDGQHVRKGQKLYEIDQQQYASAYKQALANLAVSKANEARAQQDADRYQQLAEKDAIARQTVEHAVADLNVAKSQVAASQANVVQVETNLKYSVIYAPLDGTIGISQVKVGTAVSPGSIVLNTLSQDNPMAVDFNIDEKELSRFESLEKKGFNPYDSTFTLQLPDTKVYAKPGQISLIDRAVDPQTGTIKVRLIFQNNDYTLRPGLSSKLRVQTKYKEPQIMIPYKAVTEQMGEYFVYVIGDSSKASQRKIKLGKQINQNVIVTDGLKENEQIITEGVQKVRDGAPVKQGSPKKDSADARQDSVAMKKQAK